MVQPWHLGVQVSLVDLSACNFHSGRRKIFCKETVLSDAICCYVNLFCEGLVFCRSPKFVLLITLAMSLRK